MTGFLLIDKPLDWTSHDVVGYLRKITREKRIGHAGTLDPFAIGLLVVAIGRECTKRLDEFKGMQKEYVATMRLGAISDTQDRTGVITTHDTDNMTQIDQTKVETVLQSFVGEQKQTPPMYSAKKVDGKKLYDLARKGIEIERQPNDITVYNIELLQFDGQLVTLNCRVSTGTYVRTLCHDIGQALGVGAYCEELRRTKIGSYLVDDAVVPQELTVETVEEKLFKVQS